MEKIVFFPLQDNLSQKKILAKLCTLNLVHSCVLGSLTLFSHISKTTFVVSFWRKLKLLLRSRWYMYFRWNVITFEELVILPHQKFTSGGRVILTVLNLRFSCFISEINQKNLSFGRKLRTQIGNGNHFVLYRIPLEDYYLSIGQ